MAEPLAYTIAGAAEAVSLSPDTIRKAIKGGDLVAYKPRVNGRPIRDWRIDAEQLLAWMRSGASD